MSLSQGSARQIDMVVTVKAYPGVGKKHGESVCVAGIETGENPKWIRLFPVAYRDLPTDVQFNKWQRIRLLATRPRSDPRPESWTPIPSSIETFDTLPAGDWSDRRRLVDQLATSTMCELNRQNKMEKGRDRSAPSLGVIQLRKPPTLHIVRRSEKEVEAAKQRQSQGSLALFPTAVQPIEVLDYSFVYHYERLDPECNGHKQSIIDWEIAQAYRRWRHDYPDSWKTALDQKWVSELWAENRSTRLFVGNQHQHPDGFLVLGVFWPPTGPLQGQLRL